MSNSKEILEGKFKIAKFMGYTYKSETSKIFLIGLNDIHNYNEDWNKLIPVVEKIRNLNCVVSIRFNRQMNLTVTDINGFMPEWRKDIRCDGIGIESTFKAVVEFIQWHNTNNKKHKL